MWKSLNGIVLSVCAGMVVGLPATAGEPTTAIAFEERAFSAGILFRHVQLAGRPWAVYGTGGVAADFNNDGWTDLYVIGGGDTYDALFINQGINPSTQRVWFADKSRDWGVRTRHYGYGGSAADYDNDGDLDLFVTSYGDPSSGERNGQHKLYRNDLLPDGSRVFTDVAAQAGVHQMLPGEAVGLGSAWGDPDLDGDLDLYVSGYPQDLVGNRMFRNNADGTFTDVTNFWGLNFTGVSGFVPGFVDMSRNGRPDLLLVADTGTSCYFVNKGLNEQGVPEFADRTALVDDLTTANGMGSAVGDLNKDGRLDWYVSSIYWDSTNGPGNLLMMQNQDRTFTNVAYETGVADGRWGWGVLMTDFDHDRDLDLAEVNGWPVTFANQPPQLFEQTGPMAFSNVYQESGFNTISEGRGLVNADFDNDGDQDMVVFNVGQFLNYYENQLLTPGQPVPADRNWLRIDLDTQARDSLPPMGMHAAIVVSAGGEEQLLSIDGGFNMCSQGEIGAHVGLGDATRADWVRIEWMDGSNTTILDVDANRVLTVRATAHAADLNNDGVLDLADVYELVERFMAGSLTADVNGNGLLENNDLTRFVDQFLGR